MNYKTIKRDIFKYFSNVTILILIIFIIFISLNNFFIEAYEFNSGFKGKVVDICTEEPISGVVISVKSLNISTVTNCNGEYQLMVPSGVYEIFAQASNYIEMSAISQRVSDGSIIELYFEMIPLDATAEQQEIIDKKLMISQKIPEKEEIDKYLELQRSGRARSVPSTITVLHDDGIVETMDMDEYLKGVVPKEMSPDWPLEALKAQAVAARCFAAVHPNKWKHPQADVCTNPGCCQAWSQYHYDPTNQAVIDTSNEVATYSGNIIQAFYFGHCDGHTRNSEDVWLEALPYCRSVPCICGYSYLYGHGVGMCQQGAKAMANQGYDYHEILSHYYTGIDGSSSLIPTVETRPASSIAKTSAFLNGKIVNDGGSSIIERRFSWGTTPSCSDGYVTDNPISDHYGNIQVSENNFSYQLTGLNTGVTYYFQAWAKNSTGWGSGSSVYFTTTPLETLFVILSANLQSGPAPLTTTLTATVSGTATGTINYTFYADRSDSGTNITSGYIAKIDNTTGNPKSIIHTYSSPGIYTAKVIVERGDTATEARFTITVNQPLTRIISLSGDLNFGNVQVGTTSPPKNLTISNSGNSTLTVTSISYPTGFSSSWNGTISAGSSRSVSVTFSPTQVKPYSGNLTVNSNATSGTNSKSVSGTGVPPTYPPQVTTNNDSNLTSNSAQLNGNLDSTGGLDCLVWFEHGKTTSYGISTTKQSKSSTGPFNEVISGLDANTVYYFRACASNSKGPDYGDDKTFTTKANRPGAAAFSNVTKINIQANWSANGNPSGTQYYCENTTKGTNSAWITNLYWNSTGLSANTTYHFQVKAKNKDGVGTSWIDLGSQKTEISDTTPPPAPIISSSTQPDEDKWYSNDDSVFNWATPSDSSGIAGYSYELNNSLSTVPDTTVDTTSNSKSYSNLSSGIWYFHIRAKDGVGNWGNADYYKVKIDTIFPDTSITSSGPNGTIDYNDVSFTFVGSDNLIQASNLIYSYYLYGYDSGYSAFSSNTTKSYSNLPNASYTFYVKAKDEAGNVDSSPASRSFTVNYTPTAPELFLKKSADKQTVNPSEILTYSIVYDNDGTESAQNVVIEDIIPDGMTYVANSASTNNFYHTGSVTVEVKVNNAWKVDSTTPGGLVTAVRWIFGSNISADDGDNYGSAEDESPNTGDTDAGKVTLQVTIN